MDTTRFKAYIEATSDTYFKSPIMLRGKKFGKLLDDSETGVLADSSARADTFAATSPTATADAGRPPSAWKLPQALALPSLRAQQVPTSGDSAMDMSQPLSSSSPSSAATASPAARSSLLHSALSTARQAASAATTAAPKLLPRGGKASPAGSLHRSSAPTATDRGANAETLGAEPASMSTAGSTPQPGRVAPRVEAGTPPNTAPQPRRTSPPLSDFSPLGAALAASSSAREAGAAAGQQDLSQSEEFGLTTPVQGNSHAIHQPASRSPFAAGRSHQRQVSVELIDLKDPEEAGPSALPPAAQPPTQVSGNPFASADFSPALKTSSSRSCSVHHVQQPLVGSQPLARTSDRAQNTPARAPIDSGRQSCSPRGRYNTCDAFGPSTTGYSSDGSRHQSSCQQANAPARSHLANGYSAQPAQKGAASRDASVACDGTARLPQNGTSRDTDLDPQAVALAASSEQVSPCESWDIFEPRLDDSLAADADLATALHMSRNGPELAPLKRLTGNQLLAILARGMPMRKKWLTDASAEAAAASKTSRHMRCLVADGIAYLRYHHQGLNGLMNKAEVSAVLARLEAPSGPWSRAKNLLVYTSNGLLALEAPDATAYAIWVCGLNTAFAAIQPKRARTLLSGPALSVPRQQQLTIVA